MNLRELTQYPNVKSSILVSLGVRNPLKSSDFKFLGVAPKVLENIIEDLNKGFINISTTYSAHLIILPKEAIFEIGF